MPTNASNQSVKLSKSVIEKLSAPTRGQAFYRDTELPGFGLRISEGGTKAFIIETRVNGRMRRVTLGRYGVLTAEQARQYARQELGKIALGRDPARERQDARLKATTLKHAFSEFAKARKHLSASTLKDYNRIFNTIFKPWHDKALTEINKQMVLHKHQELAETRGKAHADLSMRFLRALLNFAKEVYDDPYGKPLLPENPVRVLTTTRAWHKFERRQTYIRPADLSRWYRAVESLRLCELTDPNLPGEEDYSQYETVADLLELLLFTGLRRQEAMSLRWADVDLRNWLLTIRKTKNGNSLNLPLSDHLVKLLAGRREAAVNPYVFPGKGGHGHLIEPKRQIKKVIEASGIAFTAHDLRRTFITVAESLDISMYAIKRLVNHKLNDVTAGYIVTDIERLRDPMQKITNYLLSAVGQTDTSKIVPFLRSEKQRALAPRN